MKHRFLSFMRVKIKNQYPTYSNEKIDEIMYGIEGLYLTLQKCIIIFPVAIILGIFKELMLLLISFNFIRLFAFGMHASNSYICLIFSSLLFLGGAAICKYLIIPNYIFYILFIISFITMLLFAPSDTIKRPLIKAKKRIIYKILSLIIIIIYALIFLNFENSFLNNYLIIGLLIECILINPLTYKIFKMPYNNYKRYGLNA